MIKDRYIPVKPTKSEKDQKPKTVKRPKAGKTVPYSTSDVVAERPVGGYKTR